MDLLGAHVHMFREGVAESRAEWRCKDSNVGTLHAWKVFFLITRTLFAFHSSQPQTHSLAAVLEAVVTPIPILGNKEKRGRKRDDKQA